MPQSTTKRFVLLLFLATTLTSAPLVSGLPLGMAAITDDFTSIIHNPATLTQGRADGFAFALRYLFNTTAPSVPLSADAILNTNFSDAFGIPLYSGYHFHINALTNLIENRVGFGIPFAEVLAIGGSLTFENTDISKLDLALSSIFYPWRYISIGSQIQLENLATPKVALSLGLRPFTDAITIGVGSEYARERIALPTIMASIQPLDGIQVHGAFDIQNLTWQLVASVATSNVRVGTEMQAQESTFLSAGAWMHIRDDPFPSVIDSPPNRLVNYHIEETVPQRTVVPGSFLSTLSLDSRRELIEVLDEIHALCTDNFVSGIVIRNPISPSLVTANELRTSFSQCKAQQKSIIVYARRYDNTGYALAAAIADKLYLHPEGDIQLTGFATVRPYIQELFDTIGIGMDVIPSHPTKTAGNTFIYDSIPESERAQLELFQQSQYALFEQMITARPLTRPLQEIVDFGFYISPTQALEYGLIDGTFYNDEFEDHLKENWHAPVDMPRGTPISRSWPDISTKKVALIHASGLISGTSARGVSIGYEIIDAIKRAAESPGIHALLLRIDSGGGDGFLSAEINRELVKVAEHKPVIVWMGNVAASGGYYIAAPGATIIASPATLTGSIGVISIRPNIASLSDKIGVQWDVVRSAASADSNNLTRPYSPEERAAVQGIVDSFYQQFVTTVATQRNLEPDSVDEAAQGRIWSGKDALTRGLIDQVGSYETVLQELRTQLSSTNIELVTFEYAAETIPLLDLAGLANIITPPTLLSWFFSSPLDSINTLDTVVWHQTVLIDLLLNNNTQALFISPWYISPTN